MLLGKTLAETVNALDGWQTDERADPSRRRNPIDKQAGSLREGAGGGRSRDGRESVAFAEGVRPSLAASLLLYYFRRFNGLPSPQLQCPLCSKKLSPSSSSKPRRPELSASWHGSWCKRLYST